MLASRREVFGKKDLWQSAKGNNPQIRVDSVLYWCQVGTFGTEESLNITEMETVFWSDFMVALYWLREKGGWSVFVLNRIKEIKNLFPNSEWLHVPGKINPADLISRGCSPSHLVESHWRRGGGGPLWLVESPDTWPITM
ncbi:integrase catalytic domain-containing protein [Trichonephila inaurata madagascariensis]|uniref:Integrase catalytic domain-containing protein n=1 Tax=Trichonephila inaurata madagascariensis TaxID=2747483 RepID=A0A8X6XB52_9ARAC|nr:integrase catalytic domain-containing protein [Trichonephila inaurata madagascariensis]